MAVSNNICSIVKSRIQVGTYESNKYSRYRCLSLICMIVSRSE